MKQGFIVVCFAGLFIRRNWEFALGVVVVSVMTGADSYLAAEGDHPITWVVSLLGVCYGIAPNMLGWRQWR